MQLITHGKLASASHVFLGHKTQAQSMHSHNIWKQIQALIHRMFLFHIRLTKTNMTTIHKSIQKQKHATIKQYWLLWWKIPEGAPEGRQAGRAAVWKQVKLYESLSFTVVREHRFLGYETCIWPCLTTSNVVNYSAFVKICAPADLLIRVVSCHELLGQSYLIPQVCPIRILSRSNTISLSTRHLKTPFATNMFALSLPSFSLVALLLFELSFC